MLVPLTASMSQRENTVENNTKLTSARNLKKGTSQMKRVWKTMKSMCNVQVADSLATRIERVENSRNVIQKRKK